MSSNKNEKIDVPAITVDKNLITYGGNSFICINNISMIAIRSIPSNKSWIIAIIITLIGFAFRNSVDSSIGELIILCGVAWLIAVIIYNLNRGENLAINLNSGSTLYFNCRDREFLNKVVNIMIKSMKENNTSKYVIRFDKCEVSGGILNNSKLS